MAGHPHPAALGMDLEAPQSQARRRAGAWAPHPTEPHERFCGAYGAKDEGGSGEKPLELRKVGLLNRPQHRYLRLCRLLSFLERLGERGKEGHPGSEHDGPCSGDLRVEARPSQVFGDPGRLLWLETDDNQGLELILRFGHQRSPLFGLGDDPLRHPHRYSGSLRIGESSFCNVAVV